MSAEAAAFVHGLADVQSARIGEGTRIWQFVVVLPGAVVGRDCNLCAHCFVENDVVIGDRVTIKNGVQLWDGVRILDDVFVGPNATFTNDKSPRSRRTPSEFLSTVVEQGASIGAGATILPGLRIGRGAMVGSGAVVTRSVPPYAIVVGNPARIVGYMDVDMDGALPVHKPTAGGPTSIDELSVAASPARLVQLPLFLDMRGSLSVGEFGRSVPFEPKRYFLVFDVPSIETRGEHAHLRCHQFLVCVRGTVNVVADDGRQRAEYVLDRADLGLHLPSMVWGIQYKYSSDAVLLVFASEFYDPEDYIRDYPEFLRLARERS